MAGAKASAAGGAVAAKALVMVGVVAAAAGRAAATEALATVGTKATIEAEVAGVVLSGGWRDQAFCVFVGARAISPHNNQVCCAVRRTRSFLFRLHSPSLSTFFVRTCHSSRLSRTCLLFCTLPNRPVCSHSLFPRAAPIPPLHPRPLAPCLQLPIFLLLRSLPNGR